MMEKQNFAFCLIILSRLWQFLKKGIGIPKSSFSALLLSGIFAFCILNVFGCARTAKKNMATGITALEPSVMQKFADIPVPKGFTFLPAVSYAFKSGDVRAGVLIYTGRADTAQLVSFYQEQMPLYNWNLINAIEYGKCLLNFDRANETCVVNIEPGTFKTKVIISIGPKQQTAVKRAEKPVK